MTCQKQSNSVKVSREDSARLARLSEEITGRVEEISRILARNLDKNVRFAVSEFTLDNGLLELVAKSSASTGGNVDVEGDFTVGCYDPKAKVCCEGTCPC